LVLPGSAHGPCEWGGRNRCRLEHLHPEFQPTGDYQKSSHDAAWSADGGNDALDKNFIGSITPNEREDGKFEVMGRIEKKNDTTLEITELPIRTWTQNFKEMLEEMMPKDKKPDDQADNLIEDYREYHTENTVHFVITLTPANMQKAEQMGFEKAFKTKGSLCTTNMILFDAEGKITKFNSALEILNDFSRLRLEMYNKRKTHLVNKLTREKEILSNKARFILMVVQGELELRKKKKADLLKELRQLRFTPMSEMNAIMNGKAVDDENDTSTPNDEKTDYDYLLGMNLWSLTFEEVEKIKKLLDLKKKELDELIKTSLQQFWDRDLAALSVALDETDAAEAKDADAAARAAEGRQQKKGARGAKPAPRPQPHPSTFKQTTKLDESFLSLPLKAVEFEKVARRQVWQRTANADGEGQPAPKASRADGRKAAGVQPAVASGSTAALSEPTAKRQKVPQPVPQPVPQSVPQPVVAAPGPQTGADLLARLLLKKPDTSLQPLGEPVELGGTDDMFSYLPPRGDAHSGLGTTAACGSSAPSVFSSMFSTAAPVRPEAKPSGVPGAEKGRGRGRGRGRGSAEKMADKGTRKLCFQKSNASAVSEPAQVDVDGDSISDSDGPVSNLASCLAREAVPANIQPRPQTDRSVLQSIEGNSSARAQPHFQQSAASSFGLQPRSMGHEPQRMANFFGPPASADGGLKRGRDPGQANAAAAEPAKKRRARRTVDDDDED